jgi:threonine/homoserine/homoserine lactone efflux protein
MQSILFVRGLMIGFALAAPVGPVGVLCIKRALADGRHAAFIAGMGAALADTFFGAVAGLGLTVISSFLINHQSSIRLFGGSFLILLGLRTIFGPKILSLESVSGPGPIKDFFSTFLITLSNPATIAGALGVFAALGAIELDHAAAATVLILGVFVGSSAWWLLLSAAAGAVRSRFSAKLLCRLNRGSGLVLALTGVGIIASLGFRYFFK